MRLAEGTSPEDRQYAGGGTVVNDPISACVESQLAVVTGGGSELERSHRDRGRHRCRRCMAES
jgi:hypothetical protein